jgi:hypothetical protein
MPPPYAAFTRFAILVTAVARLLRPGLAPHAPASTSKGLRRFFPCNLIICGVRPDVVVVGLTIPDIKEVAGHATQTRVLTATFRNLCTLQRFIRWNHQMTVIIDIAEMRMRCPRCGARSTVQSAIKVRPGFEYLTLRCISCAIVFDAQVALAQGQIGSRPLELR